MTHKIHKQTDPVELSPGRAQQQRRRPAVPSQSSLAPAISRSSVTQQSSSHPTNALAAVAMAAGLTASSSIRRPLVPSNYQSSQPHQNGRESEDDENDSDDEEDEYDPSGSPVGGRKAKTTSKSSSPLIAQSDGPIPAGLAATLDHIVGKLDLLSRTMTIMEERLTLTESRVSSILSSVSKQQQQQHKGSVMSFNDEDEEDDNRRDDENEDYNESKYSSSNSRHQDKPKSLSKEGVGSASSQDLQLIQLRVMCRQRGLDSSGTELDLLRRLTNPTKEDVAAVTNAPPAAAFDTSANALDALEQDYETTDDYGNVDADEEEDFGEVENVGSYEDESSDEENEEVSK